MVKIEQYDGGKKKLELKRLQFCVDNDTDYFLPEERRNGITSRKKINKSPCRFENDEYAEYLKFFLLN